MSKQKKTPEEFCEDFVKRYFRLFNEIYGSEKEMLQYCIKFQQIYKTPRRAFEEFLTLSEFCRAMKLMKIDFIKVIMITSIIEKLSSKEDYIEFLEWVSKKEKEGTLTCRDIKKVWNEYNKDFGCSWKFRSFFRDYLTKREQLELLISVSYYVRIDDNRSPSLVPLFCYDKKVCKPKKLVCAFGFIDENCPAFKDEKILKDGIKEFADFLYNLRNRFVHDAHMFGLSEEAFGNTALLVTYVPYKFRYIKRPLYNGNVVLRLSGKKLEEILDRNFNKLLSKHIAMRKL